MTASDHYWRADGTITSDSDYNHTSETGRMQIWSRGIGYMLANPLLGVGPGNFPSAEGTLSPLAERQQYRHRRPLERGAQQLRADRRRDWVSRASRSSSR